MTQNIQYKNSSIHILIPGNYSADGYQAGGSACGIGCHDWAMLEDTYHWFQNSNHWFPANVLRHELGHNLNLWHAWYQQDYCSDTPPNSNCWNGPNCSNNMMDYNASQAAITQCQLSRMHEYLENNSSIVISGLPNYELSGQISWTGGSTALNNLNFLPDPEFEVDIEAPGASIYSWTKTYGNGNWYTNGSGSQANIEIDPMEDHMTFKVTTEANCHELEETYAFYHFPNLYKVYPNPIQNEIAISVNGEIFRQILTLQEKDFSKQVHNLRIYNQFNVLVHEGKLGSNIGTYTIDASGFKSGLYIVELSNVIFNKRYKVQKL